jgi:hypothetical protein
MRPPASRPEQVTERGVDPMITVPHLEARASRPGPAAPGASPALTPSRPDAVLLRSDRRPGLPLDQSLRTRRSAVSTRPRVPLRRKRPAGTRGSGDIDEPSAVTERAHALGDRAASEIDAPGPCLTPTCGGRMRRPRTEEWPLPDHRPRSRRQLGALDPRSPITEEGSTTVPLPPPVHPVETFFIARPTPVQTAQNLGLCAHMSEPPSPAEGPVSGPFPLFRSTFSEATEPRPFWYGS